MAICRSCDRTFTSKQALQQHIQNSSAHTVYNCEECNREFNSETALQQHLRDSPVHTITYDCDECNREFNSEHALQQHLRDSPAHRNLSPIDLFFANYVDFDYNPRNAPSDEMTRLQRCYGWERNDSDSSDAWNEYRQALVLEFEAWYGTDSDNLSVWHSLCRALQVDPIPETCTGCQQAIKGRHVNMIDLIHHRRGGNDSVQIFETLDDLRDYTKKYQRYFPKDTLERGALLQNLLRHIFVRS